MKKLSLDEIAKLELAIKQRYGDAALSHPMSCWSKETEQAYLEESKALAKKERVAEPEKIQETGFAIVDKLFISDVIPRRCSICPSGAFSKENALYLTKFGTCFTCYVKHIENREERWKNGWRPKGAEENET